MRDPIAEWICEELGAIYPDNPTGKVTDLMSEPVLDRLAGIIRVRLGAEQLIEQHQMLFRLHQAMGGE